MSNEEEDRGEAKATGTDVSGDGWQVPREQIGKGQCATRIEPLVRAQQPAEGPQPAEGSQPAEGLQPAAGPQPAGGQ